jgi:tryptophan halogenase
MNNTNNIVIVGGGSAGWMTAATLIKFFPNKTITVLESPDIPTVGVGESTLGQIRNWTNALGIDENDFLPYTNGSLKLAIKFKDFYKKGEDPFYYPFGDSFFNDSSPLGYNSWYLHKVLNPEIPVQDFARTYIPAMALIESNRYNDN